MAEAEEDPRAGYVRFVCDEALAVWATVGVDSGRGGIFVERIGQDGVPDRIAPRRLRVQARQIYVYAEASRLGLIDARTRVLAAFEAMTARFWAADGGFIFSCDAGGAPSDRARYTYEQAFALLACAGGFRLTGAPEFLEWAERILGFLDERLSDPRRGGYFDALGQITSRSQNPHMHLFEAFLALHEATGDAEWRRRAEAMLALFTGHFLDSRNGSLGEFFTPDWRPAPGAAGSVREPGHHFEWRWLLSRYRALCPAGMAVPPGAPLGFALAGGIDPRDGLAFDEIGADLRPRRASKRLWPQTELVKALLAAEEAAPSAARAARLDVVCRAILARYLIQARGLWHDQLDAAGAPISAPAPASTLYHLFVAAMELRREAAPAAC